LVPILPFCSFATSKEKVPPKLRLLINTAFTVYLETIPAKLPFKEGTKKKVLLKNWTFWMASQIENWPLIRLYDQTRYYVLQSTGFHPYLCYTIERI